MFTWGLNFLSKFWQELAHASKYWRVVKIDDWSKYIKQIWSVNILSQCIFWQKNLPHTVKNPVKILMSIFCFNILTDFLIVYGPLKLDELLIFWHLFNISTRVRAPVKILIKNKVLRRTFCQNWSYGNSVASGSNIFNIMNLDQKFYGTCVGDLASKIVSIIGRPFFVLNWLFLIVYWDLKTRSCLY